MSLSLTHTIILSWDEVAHHITLPEETKREAVVENYDIWRLK